MNAREELELLDQVQAEAEEMAGEVEELTGMGRREFVFFSVVSAAASTFGLGAKAAAQVAGGGAQQQQPAPPPLGNGEPVSWTFQPYPGGTGALMERLVRERGAAGPV